MNIIKKISLFFIFACITELTFIEITQTATNKGERRNNKKNKGANKKTNRRKNPSRAANSQNRINQPAARLAGANAIRSNNEEEERIENAWALWNNYCYKNQTDTRCSGQSTQTDSTTSTSY